MKNLISLTAIFTFFFSSWHNNVSAVTQSREAYEKTGHVHWETNPKQKLVALTFDDGPHTEITPQILDLLAKYDAKATFFITGNKAVLAPEVVKRTFAEGHEIGNHTYNHPYSKNITPRKLLEELNSTDEVLKKITGQIPTLYRPVGGLYNDTIIETAIQNGKEVIMWSWDQDSLDWTHPPAAKMANYIINGMRPGSITLFHDWHPSEYSKNSQTVKAVETILKYLKDNQYKCVTVSELLYRSSKLIPDDVGMYPDDEGPYPVIGKDSSVKD